MFIGKEDPKSTKLTQFDCEGLISLKERQLVAGNEYDIFYFQLYLLEELSGTERRWGLAVS